MIKTSRDASVVSHLSGGATGENRRSFHRATRDSSRQAGETKEMRRSPPLPTLDLITEGLDSYAAPPSSPTQYRCRGDMKP